MADVRDLAEFREMFVLWSLVPWHEQLVSWDIDKIHSKQGTRRRFFNPTASRMGSVRARVDLLRERLDEGALVNYAIPLELQVFSALRFYPECRNQDEDVTVCIFPNGSTRTDGSMPTFLAALRLCWHHSCHRWNAHLSKKSRWTNADRAAL